ncbi:hypothetical protein [Mesonia maritima]|uniref:Alkyl hydroperoxide reductase subunit C/ Thiol specific antioxidant domain-containing protein n=1 Tax=Mesonia maritima TaxID=1793873 RepID=A0ABU1K3C5_9FLAO|nr:hypothetical protein [Mesonia maritima]MDR6300110.1 hypothetical protein [Mesonia maritima]
MKKNNLQLIIFFFLVSGIIFSQETDQINVENFAKKISNTINVDKSQLFFISKESKKPDNFKESQENDLGVVNFVKNNSWVSCKNLTPIDQNCKISSITNKNIEDKLQEPNVFDGMVIKTLNSSKSELSFESGKTYAILLFSFKLSSFINYGDYLAKLKKLEKEFGIPYIVIASDYVD